jgi:hypothetical protein
MKAIRILLLAAFSSFICFSALSQWSTDPANPGLVCDLAGIQNKVKSFADGYGGVYVFWLDTRNDPGQLPKEIFGQRFDSDGYALWEENGRVVWSHFNGIFEYDVKRNDEGLIAIGMITKGLFPAEAILSGSRRLTNMAKQSGTTSLWLPMRLICQITSCTLQIIFF